MKLGSDPLDGVLCVNGRVHVSRGIECMGIYDAGACPLVRGRCPNVASPRLCEQKVTEPVRLWRLPEEQKNVARYHE